jgi:fructose-1,6-bisphosphatase/inositol monophosphatase family enzyme
MRIDVARVAETIRAVAAEEIVPRFRTLAAGDIREKKPGDLVTVADEATERALDRRLRDLCPVPWWSARGGGGDARSSADRRGGTRLDRRSRRRDG